MPKSTKHKKARVADFAKAKLKLGKGKQIAANATNTSFSAKSIALPNQSLADLPKSEPTSRRNLTITELLVQCRHYSVPVKKEALTEIGTLLDSYPHLLELHLLPLVGALSHLISDPSPSLRTAARKMLEKLCEELDEDKLAAASKGLVLFTLAALSSLDEGTRIDALKVLDLLLEYIPEEIVRGWEELSGPEGELVDRGVGAKVVEALLGVLRVRNVALSAAQGSFTSASSGDLSPAARLAILRTLSTFFTVALSPSASTSDSAWYLSSSFLTPRAYASFRQSFVPNLPLTPLHALATPSATDLFPLASLALPSLSSTSTNAPPQTTRDALLPLLHPTLLASFLDAAPTAFSPTPSSSAQEMDTIVAVLDVAKSLYWSSLSGSVKDEDGKDGKEKDERKLLVALLGHVGAYFPFGADAVEARTVEAEEQLLDLNLVFASLVSLLILSSSSGSSDETRKRSMKAKKREKQLATEGKINKMIEVVASWVGEALRGELTTASYPMGMTLSAEAYSALEPTLWALLNQPDAPPEIFDAILTHFGRCSSGSEAKRLSFGFISRAVLVGSDPAYLDRFTVSPEAAGDPESPVGKWVLSLPKLLWELGAKHPETTEMVLQFLQKIALQGPKGFFYPIIPTLLPTLVPFFHLQHPKRGSIAGPFAKLDPKIQKRALNLVWALLRDAGDGGAKLRDAAGKALESKEVKEEVREQWKMML
ncbi:Armadillo-type fold containing protein [Pseudohyphozyma bogoriensis]|nr:Armadillo-type fold containing protein [Pseudohyphozyma bogoriensis]